MNLGNNLQKLRKEKKLTQKQLAEKLNVTTVTIQNYENNRRIPNIQTLEKLANIFNVQIDYIMGKSKIKTFDMQIVNDDLKQINKLCENSNTEVSKIIRNIVDKMYLTINTPAENMELDFLKNINDIYDTIWKIKILGKNRLFINNTDSLIEDNINLQYNQLKTLCIDLIDELFIQTKNK